MTFTRRNLPHLSQNAAAYFVIYRQKGTWQADSAVAVLCQPEIARIILEDWQVRDAKTIELHAVCIMADHVHVVLSTKEGRHLPDILSSHKRRTGWLINQQLGRQGAFWQDESFDRIIREGKFAAALDYTIQNPVKAGYVSHWKDWSFTYLAPQYQQGVY